MRKSYFSQLLALPIDMQMFWQTWRDHQLTITPRADIIADSACPLRRCKAVEGQPCRPAYHQSRHNEYFAHLFIEQFRT